jgi:hypothetical protein
VDEYRCTYKRNIKAVPVSRERVMSNTSVDAFFYTVYGWEVLQLPELQAGTGGNIAAVSGTRAHVESFATERCALILRREQGLLYLLSDWVVLILGRTIPLAA